MIQKLSFFLLLFSCWFAINKCSDDYTITRFIQPNIDIRTWLTTQNLDPKDYALVLFKDETYLVKYLGPNYKPTLFPLELAEGEQIKEIEYYYKAATYYYEIIQPVSQVQKIITDIQSQKRSSVTVKIDTLQNTSQDSLSSHESSTSSSFNCAETIPAIIPGLVKCNQPFSAKDKK